jgi:hypothetical protein
MAETQKEPEYSLQNAMNKLGEICIIVSKNHSKIKMMKPEEVEKELLVELAESFKKLSVLFAELTSLWIGSKFEGVDAYLKSNSLDEKIDIRLYKTGKLDFDQMKKIMARLHRIDDIISMDEIIRPYLREYDYLCKEKGLQEAVEISNSFNINFVEKFRNHVINEGTQLENQIERCNLYYQAKLNTTTVRVAYAALAVSVISILATIVFVIFK